MRETEEGKHPGYEEAKQRQTDRQHNETSRSEETRKKKYGKEMGRRERNAQNVSVIGGKMQM